MPIIEKTYYEQIAQSLEELTIICNKLKHDNEALRAKVKHLESQLASTSNAKSDSTVDGLSDNDRIALRNQLSTYIKRIDQILESP